MQCQPKIQKHKEDSSQNMFYASLHAFTCVCIFVLGYKWKGFNLPSNFIHTRVWSTSPRFKTKIFGSQNWRTFLSTSFDENSLILEFGYVTYLIMYTILNYNLKC
mgnify:CR=1 FL=1